MGHFNIKYLAELTCMYGSYADYVLASNDIMHSVLGLFVLTLGSCFGDSTVGMYTFVVCW